MGAAEACANCNGQGWIWVERFDGDDDPDEWLCPACGGDGIWHA